MSAIAQAASVVAFFALVALLLLLILWPTVYALIKRRWRRALVYFCLTLPVFWIEWNRAEWWGPIDPENDYSPLKNSFLYTFVNWLVLTAILWTITAFTDFLFANDEPRTQDD